MNTNIETAIKVLGGQKRLADACGVSQPAVNKWLHGISSITPENAVAVERATQGQVTRFALLPSFPWGVSEKAKPGNAA